MFDFTVAVTTTLPATPDRVWGVLLDVAAWSSWTSVLAHVDGDVGVRDRPVLSLDPPTGRAYEFSPEVVVHEAPREWSWVGRTGVNGLFDGHHRFVLTDAGDGRTDLLHEETYSGLLAPVMRRTLVDPAAVEEGFVRFNEDLRRHLAEHA